MDYFVSYMYTNKSITPPRIGVSNINISVDSISSIKDVRAIQKHIESVEDIIGVRIINWIKYDKKEI